MVTRTFFVKQNFQIIWIIEKNNVSLYRCIRDLHTNAKVSDVNADISSVWQLVWCFYNWLILFGWYIKIYIFSYYSVIISFLYCKIQAWVAPTEFQKSKKAKTLRSSNAKNNVYVSILVAKDWLAKAWASEK